MHSTTGCRKAAEGAGFDAFVIAGRPRKTWNGLDSGAILAVERIRVCRDLRLIGEKAGDFSRGVDAALSSAPGL